MKRPRAPAWLRRALISLASGVLVWAVIIGLLSWGFLHPRHRPLTTDPQAALSLPFEPVSFPSHDPAPVLLKGWYTPAAPGNHPRGVIVLCHGYPGNRTDMMPPVGYLHRAGFATLAFDFRGLGESGGQTSIGLREPGDVIGAVDYLKARADTRALPVGLLGISMGAATVLRAGAEDARVGAVLADSPYADLSHAITERFRAYIGPGSALVAPGVQWTGETLVGVHTGDAAPLTVVSKISPRALFLIHGTADRLIPVSDSRLLLTQAGPPKQLWIVPGAGHVGAYAMHPSEYERRAINFFARVLAR